ncbi:solute carrier family 35 member G1-like [Apostichopus japonicus]|uniref:solute carrier family 35 member G1-like n=1 Tax=Stichopus japonicus TaxID=307972 RepID=UPI003AB45AE1
MLMDHLAKKMEYSGEQIPLKQIHDEKEGKKKSVTVVEYFKTALSLFWERRYLLLVVLGAFFNALRTLLSKVVLFHIDPVMTGWTERATMMICCVPAILWYRLSLRTTVSLTAALLVTGVLSAAQIILIMTSYKYLNVGDAGAIISCNPIIIGILAWIFLSEKLLPVDLLSCVVAVLGVMLLSRPSEIFDGSAFLLSNLMLGITAAIGGAFSIAIGGVLKRLLCIKEVNKHVSLLYVNFTGALICSIICTILEKWQLPNTITASVFLVLSGICGYLNNLMIMIALCHEKAYHVFVVNTSSVAMVYMLQYIFLDVSPDIYSTVGATCVILSVVLISRTKTENTEEED